MSSDQNILQGAQNTNAPNGHFNAANGDINYTYVNPSVDEEKILAILKPVEREGRPRECMEGTRKGILAEIDHWMDDFTAPNILLLTGSPGAGKSAIAATVVSRLHRRRRLGSSFAFKHNDASLSDPSAVWRTVATDLARFHPCVKDNLTETLRGVDPGWTDISLQFQELLEAPLRKSQDVLSQKPPVIVLDALDECASNGSQSDQRRTLLNTLTKWAGLPKTFKLVVTSRDERLPNSFRQVCWPLAIHTGSCVTKEASDDIQMFLEKRFAEIAERFEYSLHNWPGEPTIKVLTALAAGLFIWAETLARFMEGEDSLPKEQLHLVLSGDFGKEGDPIKGLYQRILNISFKNSKARTLDAFRRIVGTIVLAKVPLHRDHLADFLRPPVEGELIDLVLTKLSSVFSIGKTDKFIHICHLSFADFLFDPGQSHEYSIDRVVHSQNLASACFRLMKAGLRFNICGLETSHRLNDEVEDLPSRIQRSIPPSLSYACRFAAQHLRETPHGGGDSGEILNDIDDFLHDRLLYWLEVMSLIKEVSVAPTALLMMAKWAEQTPNTDLAAFAQDATRFVVNFMAPITASAPHTYLSTLPWSPRESKVAEHFLPDFPHMYSVLSGKDHRWPATINVLRGHTDRVESVEFSPDGRRIVSGSRDKTIRIWDAETGEAVVGPMNGHTQYVTSVGFSPDGKHVVSGSDDNTIRIWDAETGEAVVGSTNGHTDSITSIGFSPDGKRIVSGSYDNTIRIWDAETGEAVADSLSGHTDWVLSVGFSPNGKRVVSGSSDKTIRIWDANTGEVVRGPMNGHTSWIESVQFSPDGKLVVLWSYDNTIRIWDADTGEAVGMTGHTGSITSVGFSRDGKRVVSALHDNTIRIWDAETGVAIGGPINGHTAYVTSVGFSPDGKRIVSGSDDKTIRIWDAQTAAAAAGLMNDRTDCVMSVGFSPDGKRVVSGSLNKTIWIWDAQTGEAIVGPMSGHTDYVRSVGFSPDGKRVVSGSRDKTIRIWDAETGDAVGGPMKGHTGSITSVGFSPDGKRVVSGSDDKKIRTWDVETGEAMVGPMKGHTNCIRSVGFSPDGKRVVSGSDDKEIRIWDAETGEAVVGPMKGHTDYVRSVGFSPDGKRVVSGSDDQTVRIWDAEMGEAVRGPMNGHTNWIRSVGFSPDGMLVVSGSADNTIRIWDAKKGEAVGGPMNGHAHWVESVGFSPDGKLVVSGSNDRTIRIWHAKEFSSFHNCHFDFSSGWVKTDNGDGLLFWVPVHCRGRVCGTDTIVIIGADMVKLDLSSFVHGHSWTQCRQVKKETSGSSSTIPPSYNRETTALPALSSSKPSSPSLSSSRNELDVEDMSSVQTSTHKSTSKSDSPTQIPRDLSQSKPTTSQPPSLSSSLTPTHLLRWVGVVMLVTLAAYLTVS